MSDWLDILGCEDDDANALADAGVKKVSDGDALERLPSGGLVFYQDSTHRYFWIEDGKENLTSVTSVLKVLDKPALVHSAWKLGLENLDYRQEWGKAATRGTSVHAAMEGLAVGAIPDLDEFPSEDRGYVAGLAAAWADLSPRVAASEVIVASRGLGIAGRFDLLAEARGEMALIDLKTNKPGRAYDSHHLQLGGYRLLMGESGWALPDAEYVLAVGEDGSWDFVKSQATVEDFVAVLGAFRAHKGLEKRLKEAA